MKHINENMELITQFMELLQKQFGFNCEIVLHDFTKDYNHTIVDIRNGHITGRAIGGCGTNLGLEVINGTTDGSSKFNYITYTKGGKILRSSSLYFKNDAGELIGALCINLDITDSVKYENYLRMTNGYDLSNEPVHEFFVSDVQQLLDELIRQALKISGKEISDMTREDKIAFIEFLNKKGALGISKSSERICELLEISKYTFYNYLDFAKKNEKNTLHHIVEEQTTL